MALVVRDRVKEQSTTTGTGTVTLSGAYDGYRTFASCVPDGSVVYYTIHNTSTGYVNEWEVGYGTFTSTGTTLSRTTVYSSSNAGSLVNFSAGTKEVFITYPAEAAVYEDTNGVVANTSFGTLTAGTWNGSTVAAAYGGTGNSTYSVGDILYASTTTALSALADVATGNALLSGGVGTAPAWGKIGLTTHISGTLGVSNGGTGATTANTAFNALAPSQSTHSGKYLTTNGTDTSWATVSTDSNSTTKGLYEHSSTISANYTISTGNNAVSAGPISIASGVTVTVPTGSRWIVL